MNGFALLSRSRRGRLLRSATALVLAAGLAVAAPLVRSTPARAQVPVTHFAWTATAGDTIGDSALISTGATDGEPGDLLFVTPSPYRGETCPCLAVPPVPVIGVMYDRALGKWAVMDENRAAMPADETFSVLAEPGAGRAVFVVRATHSATSGDHVFISSSLTNGKPHAVLEVTQVWNPAGTAKGVYNANPIGVRYYPSKRKWAILNENGSRMPSGAAFNVLVGTTASGGGTAVVAATTTASRVGRGTVFSDPVTNAHPDALVLDTPDWNPGGKGGTTSLSQTAVEYDSTLNEWAVVDETPVAPPLKSAYNVLAFPAAQVPVTHFAWTATSAYVGGDTALIDDRATNSQPADLLFVTPSPYRGETCPCLAVAPLPPIGVWYDQSISEWAVFTEDRAGMPADETFDVLAEPATGAAVFVLRATHANTVGDHVFINSRLTNDKPNAELEVTQDWNPGGGTTGVYNPHPIGVRYYKAQRKWAVINEDIKPMPAGGAFNVLVGSSASGGGASKVTTATTETRAGMATIFSDPLSNANPGAFVFVTPDWNPGGKGGTTSTSQTAVVYDPTVKQWAVLDQNGSPPPLKSAYNLLIFPS
jgi:hypothetical protein